MGDYVDTLYQGSHASGAASLTKRNQVGDWLFVAAIMFCLVALLVGWFVLLRYLFREGFKVPVAWLRRWI